MSCHCVELKCKMCFIRVKKKKLFFFLTYSAKNINLIMETNPYRKHIAIYVYIYICIHICLYVHIQMYIHFCEKRGKPVEHFVFLMDLKIPQIWRTTYLVFAMFFGCRSLVKVMNFFGLSSSETCKLWLCKLRKELEKIG